MRYYEDELHLGDLRRDKIIEESRTDSGRVKLNKVKREYFARFGGSFITGPVFGEGGYIGELVLSHGGFVAVYEECLRRGIPWYELLGVPKPGDEPPPDVEYD